MDVSAQHSVDHAGHDSCRYKAGGSVGWFQPGPRARSSEEHVDADSPRFVNRSRSYLMRERQGPSFFRLDGCRLTHLAVIPASQPADRADRGPRSAVLKIRNLAGRRAQISDWIWLIWSVAGLGPLSFPCSEEVSSPGVPRRQMRSIRTCSRCQAKRRL